MQAIPKPSARDRILDSAEHCFAVSGIENVSLRAIAAAAKISLSNLQYYYSTKQQVLEACFSRRIEPVNEGRIGLLKELLARPRTPSVEAVVEAWTRPLVEAGSPDRVVVIMRFIAKFLTSVPHRQYMVEHYDEVGRYTFSALRRALPTDTDEDLVWKYNFMIGAMVFTLGGQVLMARLPREFTHIAEKMERQGPLEVRTLDRLVAFIASGMKANVSKSATSKRTIPARKKRK